MLKTNETTNIHLNFKGYNMNLNDLGVKQYQWVEAMNWHNKTVLESLALISSEVGESAYEHLDDEPTEHFGEELADIMLRTLDLGCCEKVDMNKEIANCSIVWKHKNIPKMFMQLSYEFGNLVNTARKPVLEESFHKTLGIFIKSVMEIAEFSHIDLEKEILLKMAINLQRGTRGRII